MKMLKRVAVAAVIGMLTVPSAWAAGKIMITSYVNDFQFANGNIGCPKGPWGNAFAVSLPKLIDNMPLRQAEEMMRLIDDYEALHGLKIESRTEVRDFEVIEDRIKTTATGPVDELGTQLCSLIGANL